MTGRYSGTMLTWSPCLGPIVGPNCHSSRGSGRLRRGAMTRAKMRFRQPCSERQRWLSLPLVSTRLVSVSSIGGEEAPGRSLPLRADTAVVWLDDTGDEDPGRVRPFSSASRSAPPVLSQAPTDTYGSRYFNTCLALRAGRAAPPTFIAWRSVPRAIASTDSSRDERPPSVARCPVPARSGGSLTPRLRAYMCAPLRAALFVSKHGH